MNDAPVLLEQAFADLALIRHRHPIVHNVTNFVVMQTSANLLLAIGASPIMAHAKEELSDIIAIANALVINIGTLEAAWIAAIELAQQAAKERKIPIVFDPVGAGATKYRTHVAKEILAKGVDIVRGNAGEILALVTENVVSKGVDSHYQSNAALSAAKNVANHYHCTVVISGEIDIVVNAQQEIYNHYGTPLFTSVTGMGCSATAVIGAFAAVNKNYFQAATHAMLLYTLAGQMAATKSHGPASFLNEFTDTLFSLQKKAVQAILPLTA